KFANARFETKEPSNASLQRAMKLFRHTVARVRFLMVMPAVIGHAGMDLQRTYDTAEIDVTGTLIGAHDSLTDEIKDRMAARFNELWKQQIAADIARQRTPEWDETVREAHEAGTTPVNMLTRAPQGTIIFDVFLSYIVVGGWTAFETMAGDLWEQAVNIHPETLAALVGTKPIKSKEKDGFGSLRPPRQATAMRESKSIDLDILRFHNFDVKDKMGTLLKGRYDFARLSEIRLAYVQAFSEYNDAIYSLLGSNKLDALNAIRNVIVHNAAFADEKYLKN